MIKIRGNAIYLTRGDSADITIAITNSKGNAYDMQDGDTIAFTVKRTTTDKDALISKTADDGVIHLVPGDTESLGYGDYVYDCQLTTADGRVCTFIVPTLFRVLEEVTY